MKIKLHLSLLMELIMILEDCNNTYSRDIRNFTCAKKMVYLLAFTALIIGGSIYLLWRPTTIRIFHLIDMAGLGFLVEKIRAYSEGMQYIVPQWVLFSLPNGLWAFSYTLLITYVWVSQKTVLKYFWYATIPIICFGYETLQFMKVISGTFCHQDLFFCFTGVIFGIILAMRIKRRSS